MLAMLCLAATYYDNCNKAIGINDCSRLYGLWSALLTGRIYKQNFSERKCVMHAIKRLHTSAYGKSSLVEYIDISVAM